MTAPSRSGWLRALAALLLAIAAMGSCLVPQEIQQYQAPPAATHSPPVLVLETAYPPDAVKCLDPTSLVSTPSFSIVVSDADGVKGQQLHVRWFLNYSVDAVQSLIPLAPPADVMLSPVPNTGLYPLVSLETKDLGLPLTPAGIYALEAVVSDQFDTTGAQPPNRAAAAGFNVTSYKWVLEYRGNGVCPTP